MERRTCSYARKAVTAPSLSTADSCACDEGVEMLIDLLLGDLEREVDEVRRRRQQLMRDARGDHDDVAGMQHGVGALLDRAAAPFTGRRDLVAGNGAAVAQRRGAALHHEDVGESL